MIEWHTSVEPAAVMRNVPRSPYVLGRARIRKWILGMTLSGVAGFVVLGFITGPRILCGGPSKADLGDMIAKKYAHEAFPQWRVAHPDRTCPTDLSELNEWMDMKGIKDPWGSDYVFHCSDDGILVRSPGEDADWGTADDVWSDR